MLSVKGCRIVFIIGVVAVFSLIEILGLQKEACIFFIGLAIYFFVVAFLLLICLFIHCFFAKRAKDEYYKKLLNKRIEFYTTEKYKGNIESAEDFRKWVDID